MKSIPQQITVDRGQQNTIQKTIDDFFSETRDFVKDYKKTIHPSEVEIKSRELSVDKNSPITEDSRVTYLTYKDSVIAAVFETKTELDKIRYTFLRNLTNIG